MSEPLLPELDSIDENYRNINESEININTEKNEEIKEENEKEKNIFSNEKSFNIIKTRSSFRNCNIIFLSFLQKHFIILLLIEYIIGFIFLGLPILLYYINDQKFSISFSYFISISVLLILISSLFVYRIYDDISSSYSISKTWERTNLLSILEMIISFIIILIISIFFLLFEIKIKKYQNENITFDSQGINCNEEDLLFKFILLHYFYYPKFNISSFSINFHDQQKNDLLNDIRKSIYYVFLPLFIFVILKNLKYIFIRKKYPNERNMTCFCLIIILVTIYLNWEKKINYEKKVIYFQIIVLLTLLTFNLIWVIKDMIKRIIKRRDNELKIFAFPFYIVFLSFISDIFIIIGIFLCFHSFILSFYYLISNNFEDLKDILNIFNKLKLGIPSFMIGHIFHFGKKILNLVLYPIAYEYCSSKLKNIFYIRINKEGLSKTSINTHSSSLVNNSFDDSDEEY